MKDSGIEWIGEIPKHWSFYKIKHFFDFEKGKNAALYTQEYIGEHIGEYPLYSGQTENNGVMGRIDTFDYDLGKCLFTTTVGAKVMTPRILQGKFSLSQNCLIMKQIKDCSIEFFYYALLPLFAYEKSMIPSYMQPSLRMEDLRKYGFFIPSISEQKAIADFLDRRCAEIDAVIEQTKVTIEEYKKLKQSVITEAVTKGIRGDRPMKDSGIEWIGEIPSHWGIIKFKYLHNGLNTGEAIDKNFWSSQLTDRLFYTAGLEPIRTTFEEFPNWKYTSDNDLLLARNGTPYVYLPSANACYTDHIIRALMKTSSNRRFVRYSLQQSISSVVVETVSIPTWSASLWNEQSIPHPSLEEQEEIVSYLDQKCAEIDTLIEKKTALLEEMETYKKSVIYEYVTGKKEVYQSTGAKESIKNEEIM